MEKPKLTPEEELKLRKEVCNNFKFRLREGDSEITHTCTLRDRKTLGIKVADVMFELFSEGYCVVDVMDFVQLLSGAADRMAAQSLAKALIRRLQNAENDSSISMQTPENTE